MGELHVSTRHISAIYGSRDTCPAKTIPLFQEQEQNTSELRLRSHILQAKVFTQGYIILHYFQCVSSGNHTPGSIFYSIPWQTPFTSTSSYSSIVQSTRLLVLIVGG